MTRSWTFPAVFAVLVAANVADEAAAQEMPQPYSEYFATVERIIDGDTLEVRVDLWPGLQAINVLRVRGIDAPELRGAKCVEEKLRAEQAKAQAERLYGIGTIVRLEKVELDSFGRTVADVRRWRSDRWLYFADEMVERGMAEAWLPDQPDLNWCDLHADR